MAAANEYLNQTFIPDFNRRFGRAPKDPESAFVDCNGTDLKQIFCIEVERVVNKDNTVSYKNKILQLEPQPNRRTCAGLHVVVRHHLDGGYSICKGPRLLGVYNAEGKAVKKQTKKEAI